MNLAADFGVIVPELVVVATALVLLMVGAFGERRRTAIRWLAVAALVAVAGLVAFGSEEPATAFRGMIRVDAFARFMKLLILIGVVLTLLISPGFLRREGIDRFEYTVLVLFATAGMMVMVSASDLLVLYVGLELQSLPLYVLAAFQRDSTRATESGLKYFVLGALSSGMLLYGSSLVYGFTGATGFAAIAEVAASASGGAALGILVGIVFIAAALAFKVSAVPFHMWTPDVYEGAPTPVTAFFAVAPKIAAMALFLRVMIQPFGPLAAEWQQIIVFIAAASMILGAFAAIGQTNIKRLMAYSSIGHVGYALIGLAAGGEEGVQGVIVYFSIYLVMSVGAFGCILCMRREGRMVEEIDELAGLSRAQPALALAFGIFMFAMAGIPPLAGFFGKLYVFLAAVRAELYVLAVIGVLSSVVAAYYYLRIVKLMYFDDGAEAFDRPVGRVMSAVLAGTALATFWFFLYPAPVLQGAQAAAASLFP